MSRADRIVQRRAWLSSNPWKDEGKGKQRKSWRAWVLEWLLFKSHDAKTVKDGIARKLNERETARAKAQAAT